MMISDEAPAMLNRLKALSLLAPEALIPTPVADSDVLVAHKNGTDSGTVEWLTLFAHEDA